MRESLPAHASAISADPSVEASSTIRNSKLRNVWLRMLRIDGSRKRPALKTVIRTLMTGSFMRERCGRCPHACSTHFAPSKRLRRETGPPRGLLQLGKERLRRRRELFSCRRDQLFPGKCSGNQHPAGGRDQLWKTSRGGTDHRKSAGERFDDHGGAGIKILWMEQDVMAAIKFSRFILGERWTKPSRH